MPAGTQDVRRGKLSVGNLVVRKMMQVVSRQVPLAITMTPAAGAANETRITFQFQDGNGNAVAEVANIDVWLSDAASGAGLTATTASGAVNVYSTGNGADLAVLVAKKALRVQTNASGAYVLTITDTAKTLFYPCAQAFGGITIVGARLTTPNYG